LMPLKRPCRSAKGLGKAVLVATQMPFLQRYDRAPLIQPILSRNGRALGTFSCGPK
jgi:hypothetical protein